MRVRYTKLRDKGMRGLANAEDIVILSATMGTIKDHLDYDIVMK